jgi:hypothetical protein
MLGSQLRGGREKTDREESKMTLRARNWHYVCAENPVILPLQVLHFFQHGIYGKECDK